MEVRFEAIESDISTLRADVAVIRSNYVTKAELAVVKEDLAVIRSNYVTKDELAVVAAEVAIIRSNYVTREDLQRELNNLTWKIFGFATLLTAAVFYIARYVH